MALVRRQYHIDDLTYWPQLRHFSSNFLKEVDRFYLFNKGRCLLFITHDDRVYFSDCVEGVNLEDLDQWFIPREVEGFSGRRVVMVISKGTRMYALTEDGLVLYMAFEVWWTETVVIHTRAAHIAIDYELFLMTLDGELLMLNMETGSFQVVELVGHGRVFAIECFRSQVAALTSTGQCLIIEALRNDNFLPSTIHFRILKIPPLPAQPVAVHFNYSLTILAADGKIYSFTGPNYPSRPDGLIYSHPSVTSLDKPIRHIYDFAMFEDISGQLYSYSISSLVLSIPSEFTSFADLHATNFAYPSSPGLTTLSRHAFHSAGLFNNPLTCDLRITDRHFGAVPRKTRFYVSRDVLSNALPSLREELHKSTNWLTIRYKVMSKVTLLHYLRYLHTRSADNFEQCAFTLYLQAQLLQDKTTESLLVEVISRQLSRLYQISPFQYRVYLESNIFFNIYNFVVLHENQPEIVGRVRVPDSMLVFTRTQPDSTLRARLLRYVLWHPNRVRSCFQPHYLFMPLVL